MFTDTQRESTDGNSRLAQDFMTLSQHIGECERAINAMALNGFQAIRNEGKAADFILFNAGEFRLALKEIAANLDRVAIGQTHN